MGYYICKYYNDKITKISSTITTSSSSYGWFRTFKLKATSFLFTLRIERSWHNGHPFICTYEVVIDYTGCSCRFISGPSVYDSTRDQPRGIRLIRKDNDIYLDIGLLGGTIIDYNQYTISIEGSSIDGNVTKLTPYFVPVALQSGEILYFNEDIIKSYRRFNWASYLDKSVCSCPDYSDIVIPMVRLSATNSSNGEEINGMLYISRTNGSARGDDHIIGFHIQDPYALNYIPMVEYFDFNSTGRQTSYVKFCKFKYNDVWYGGLHITAVSSSVACRFFFDKSILNMTGCLSYYTFLNHNTGDILNQEIYDSLSYEIIHNSYAGDRVIKYNDSYIGGYTRSFQNPVQFPLSINGGQGANVYLLMWSVHWSDGNNSASGLLMIRCGYSGNNYNITEIAFDKGPSNGTSYTYFFTIYIASNGEIIVTKTGIPAQIRTRFISLD